ncbi:MAG TPA: GNAT family protein [Pyrinomonadaceae bacterium]
MKIEPITLEGEFVRLEPLSHEKHFADLCAVGLDAEIWRWSPKQIKTEADLQNYIETALDEQRRGVSLPFATVSKETGKAIGSTRFGNIDAANKRVEIGWTWIGLEFQRTFVNTEAKFLMLSHAFETWSCNRVELKTDALNERSRRAILRIGAKEEGIFRKHAVTDSGRLRDTVYFSILDDEWQAVKQNLQNKLQAKS